MKKHFYCMALASLCACGAADAYETPTMGWSSWNTYGFQISEDLIKAQTDAMVEKGLKDVGYTYINIDDGFFGGRDSEGHLLIHPTRFPNGMQPVVDYIHSKGLKAGIYSDAGENTCASYFGGDLIGKGVGLYGHDQEDIDLYFKTLGFDFIKVDFCGGEPGYNEDNLELSEQERYTDIHQAIVNTGRTDVRLNVCRWAFPGTWVHDVATSWRVTGDIYLGWNSVKGIIGENLYLSAYATEGKFNDMDMLEVGRGLSTEEDKTHFGMWCIMSSPLLIGCDMTTISQTALDLLTNKELIALNQDPLALQAYVVKRENGAYVLVKDVETLHGTQRAVAFYNPTDSPVTLSVDFLDLGLGGKVSVRDLFMKEDLGDFEGDMTVELPAHGTRIYKLQAEERYERMKYEGETAWLDAYQELMNNQVAETGIYEEADYCSGGAKAGWLGRSEKNDLQWRNVYSEEGGEYELTLTYICGEERKLYLSVNGGEGEELALNSGGWDQPARQTVKVTLQKGDNLIRLYNAAEWMPDIDCMELVKANSLDVYRHRLESAVGKAHTVLQENLPGNVRKAVEDALAAAEQVEESREGYEQATEALLAAVENALQAQAGYESFTALLEQCRENADKSEAGNALEQFVAQMEQAVLQMDNATTKESVDAAVASLKDAAVAFLTSAEAWPKEGESWDVTLLMDNPSFDPEEKGWNDMPTQRSGVAEFYNRNFNMYQTLTGLKNGKYTIQVKALYRTGENDGGEAYKNGTETIPATLFANEKTQPVVSLYAFPYEEENPDFGDLDLKNGYINSMYAAGVCFAQGWYVNTMEVDVEDGKLRLGLMNNGQKYDCWCCFDDFRLYYEAPEKGDGVAEVLAQEGRADVYTIDGVRLKADVPEAEALDGLRKGTYIVNGKKIVKD